MKYNLFHLPDCLPDEETGEVLAETSYGRVERIISLGQASPDGFWYDQEEDEWVTLLQGSAVLTVEDRRINLSCGQQIFLPAHVCHRIEKTSVEPPCIWLCVFFKTGDVR